MIPEALAVCCGHQKDRGPLPMQLVVVIAVTKAVRAATMTLTTISMMFFFLSFMM